MAKLEPIHMEVCSIDESFSVNCSHGFCHRIQIKLYEGWSLVHINTTECNYSRGQLNGVAFFTRPAEILSPSTKGCPT